MSDSAVRKVRGNSCADGDYQVGYGRPPKEHQFKKGHTGRPKGARNRLSERFLRALSDDFEAHGAEVLARLRRDDPGSYIRAVNRPDRPAFCPCYDLARGQYWTPNHNRRVG